MRTLGLVNPYFATNDPWQDWSYARGNGTTYLTDVDSIRYGMMTNRPNPMGFPLVGDTYMLLARSYQMTSDTPEINELETDTSYTWNVGDIVTFDWGCWPTVLDVNTKVSLTCAVGAGARGYMRMPTAIGVHTGKFAHYVDVTSGKLAIGLYGYKSSGDTVPYTWVSIDNIRVCSILDYVSLADANDVTGVS